MVGFKNIGMYVWTFVCTYVSTLQSKLLNQLKQSLILEIFNNRRAEKLLGTGLQECSFSTWNWKFYLSVSLYIYPINMEFRNIFITISAILVIRKDMIG